MQYLSAEERENKNKTFQGRDVKRAKSIAFRYLTNRDRSHKEIVDHLRKKQFDQATILETTNYLLRLGYINDKHFALNWGKYWAKNKNVGKLRLLKELVNKGIPHSLAEETVGKIFSEFDEWELAKICVEKKIRSLSKFNIASKRRKLAGHLDRKGFSTPVILNALNHFTPFSGSLATDGS
tara:strand:- start:949 stop:1491 length:543 start_codon:yes stop_codon:yes gene_type:complete